MPSRKERKRIGKAAPAKGRRKQDANDWQVLEGWAGFLGFIKWCSFAACLACFLSNALAWPWLAIGVVAWVAASWARHRSNCAFERRYGPKPPPAPYVPDYERQPQRSLGTAESILIGVLLGGLFFGGGEDDE